MTNNEVILILKTCLANMRLNRSDKTIQEAFDKAMDALFKLEMIKSYGCVVCEESTEHGCNGCAYDGTEDWKDPCRICRRNQKDYYRKAAE